MIIRFKNFIIIIALTALFLPGCATTHGGYYLKHKGIIGAEDLMTINGAEYVSLDGFCGRNGFSVSIDPVSGVAEFRGYNAVAKVLPDSQMVTVNGSAKRFSPETVIRDGRYYIAPSLAAFLMQGTAVTGREKKTEPIEVIRGPTVRTVVIDPGHGGKDPGALGRYGIREKNLVLDIGKRLKDDLERDGQFKVSMTRADDTFISLKERPRVANRARADLFISIHSNASKSRNAKGFEVYYLSDAADDNARALEAAENESLLYDTGSTAGAPPDAVEATLWDMALAENRVESRELADYVCDASKDGLCTKTRGSKSANFYVLKGTHMPSILIEVGFVSNRSEAENLNDPNYRQRIAAAIGDGIRAYKAKFEKTEGFTKKAGSD
ncbi:MAG: N-acetylmuramoyl-L-alanine amidase [Candidatus Omnitrophica bacterium]|nr:N-acetylmuramoyl-L-alanine amidase [Candidatus Omnitrophota bacterium]